MFKGKTECVIWLCLINSIGGFSASDNQVTSLTKFWVHLLVNSSTSSFKLFNFLRIHYLRHIIKFPLSILTFLQLIFKLFIFYSPSANHAWFKSFSEFLFLLLPKWSTFVFCFLCVLLWKSFEICSFLTNNSVSCKK